MYKLTNSPSILRVEDNAFIPPDADNTDYQRYLDWVNAGNTVAPADPLPVVSPQVSPRQIRMAMSQLNMRSSVEAAVAAGDQDLKDWYEFSTYFDRNHPQVLAMAALLGIASQDLDALWSLAATL